MTKNNQDTPKRIKQRQYLHLGALVGLMGLVAIGFKLIANHHQVNTESAHKIVQMDGPVNTDEMNNIWLEQTQNDLKDAKTKQSKFEKSLLKLDQEKKAEQEKAKLTQQQLEELKDQVASLQEALKAKPKEVTSQQPSNKELNNPYSASNPFGGNSAQFQNTNGFVQQSNMVVDDSGIQDIAIELTESPKHALEARNIKRYVPTGSYLKAVVIGGADTSAGVSNQSNPVPILLRVTSLGTAPNGKKLSLKGCRLTAAAIGDISSERSQIRLERISCVRKNGHVVDLKVKGTVFGPSGNNGVRGRKVTRNTGLLYNAGLSGFFSGIGGGLAQQYSTISQSPLGATQTITGKDVFKNGLARGAESALGKLSDYYIKQAELYHPIIELNAGTEVDVVFLEGFDLGAESIEKNTSSKTNSNNTASETDKILSQMNDKFEGED